MACFCLVNLYSTNKLHAIQFLFLRRDHLLSTLGIIYGSGSFAVQFGEHFRSGDHLRCCTVLRLQEYIGYLTVIHCTISDCPKLRLTCSLRSFSSSISSSHSQFVIWAAILKKESFWGTMGYHTFSCDALWSMALMGPRRVIFFLFFFFFSFFECFLYFYRFCFSF